MSKKIFHKAGAVAFAAILAVPFAAQAESTFVTGTGTPLTTNARSTSRSRSLKFLGLQVR